MLTHSSTQLVVEHDGRDNALAVGPALYIHPTEPRVLLRCLYEPPNEVPQDAMHLISEDHGQTWGAPIAVTQRLTTPEGDFGEYTDGMLLDPLTGDVLVFGAGSPLPQGDDTRVRDRCFRCWVGTLDLRSHQYVNRTPIDFDLPLGNWVSFCRPILLGRDRIICPTVGAKMDAQGQRLAAPNDWSSGKVTHMVIGDRHAQGWRWHKAPALEVPLAVSSRGINEPTVLELRDGRILAIMRGDNSRAPHMPGFKWVSLSSDRGESWSTVVPLRYDDDGLHESGSNGSSLFRSSKTGKAYWIGNVLRRGERVEGNLPRRRLAMFEVDEDRIALKRDTMLVIDEQQPDDSDDLQLSNFKFFEDRLTGDLRLFMIRMFQRGKPDRSPILQYHMPVD